MLLQATQPLTQQKNIDRGNRGLITKAASAYVIKLRVTVGERVVKNEGIDSQI